MPVPVLVTPAPPSPPVVVDAGAPTAEWVSPVGTVLDLSDAKPANQLFTLPAVGGWGAGPVEIVSDPHPRGGSRVRHIRDQPRDIHWSLHVYGDTYTEFQTRWQQVVRAFTDTKRYGAGILRVRRPDGSARQIEAFYSEGLEGRPGENWLYANPVVTLHCPDPYWRAVTPIQLAWAHGTPVDFYSPFMSISSSRTLGEATVNNPGDTTAWPEITLTGPATSLDATLTTTGENFVLTHTLASGEQATIVTQRPRVRGDAGQNIADDLNWPGAVLWGLPPGTNSIDLQVGGADAGTRVDLTFTPRFESH